MKITEIRLSKTFSIIFIIIIASVFLLPVLGMHFMLWLVDRNEQRAEFSLDESIEFQIKTVKSSIKQLEIVDLALLQCISEHALERASLPPASSGSIEFVDELEWLNCSNRNIVNLDGISGLQKLTALNLANNNIANIHLLAKLDKLEDLDLSNNMIVNIDSLTALPRLNKLRLSGNHLDDIKPLLALISLGEVYMPDVSKIYCADLERLLNEARFVVHQNNDNQACKGDYSSEIAKLRAIKKAGGILSPDDESMLLEYELNEMKRDYQRKYN